VRWGDRPLKLLRALPSDILQSLFPMTKRPNDDKKSPLSCVQRLRGDYKSKRLSLPIDVKAFISSPRHRRLTRLDCLPAVTSFHRSR
jgi:hypothetical protein